MKQTMLIFFALMSLPVIAGTIYEWKDPETGKLMAGDKPPTGGVKYWVEGERQNPKSEQKPQSVSRLATQEEVNQCLQIIRDNRSWKDPDSLKVEGTTFITTLSEGYTQMIMDVNAKNSYGAYAGAKIAICKYKNGQFDELIMAP